MVNFMDFYYTGPGTLAGRYMRKFWHPVLRAEDLKPGWAKPIKILGEEFTLYRGEGGKPHVVDFRCAHRQTQLSVGWVEDDCIRCRYHGWKFDGTGQCVQQPMEAADFAPRVRIPSYPLEEYLGLIFVYFFSFKFGLFPISGYSCFFDCGQAQQGPVQWAYHLVLPWLTFAILFAALYVRMIRANVMETLNEDYVRTARAKGAPEWLVMRSHVLRNALLPVVTMLGMDIGVALGGAIFTESVYGLQGLGKTAIQAIENFDLPTEQGVVVFATLCIITFNLLVDLLYAVIDPRIRLS